MASNSHEWAALPQRKRPDKRTRDNQSKILAQLKEMFGTTFETDIIATVANHCQYKLEPAIETLITLSSQSAPQPSNTDFLKAQTPENDLWQADEFPPTENTWIEGGVTENELRQHHEQIKRFEEEKHSDFPPQNDQEGEVNADDEDSLSYQNIGRQARKVETASLCGLKVQYRPKGIDYKSDDDADVVIEDEASDYKVDPEPISVCHFLANTTQCPPKNTFPKVECISTPSPPLTPRHQLPSSSPPTKPSTAHEKHLQRIESDIAKGWKVLIILRGCPGSGKSYLAQSIVSRTVNGDFQNHIFSADHYFSHINGGVYVFDPSKLHEAHVYCHSRVANAVRLGVSPIIVDNTNTQAWELKPYAVMGVDNGYIIETLEPDTPWARKVSELAKRNQHGVPKLKIKMMLDRFEWNISGDRLIRMFNLGYAPYNRPPQMRKLPPLSVPKPALPPVQILKGKSNFTDLQPPAQKNGSSTIAKEYSNLETLCNANVTLDPPPCSTPMLSIEGNSFKEENLIELGNLGAIGSERKISNAEEVKVGESFIELSKLGAIGSERNISKEEVVEEEPKKTMMNLDDTEPMAKLSLDEDNKTEANMNTSGAFDTTEEEEEYFLDAEEMISRDSESSKNSSDHSTDFEKVDMTDVSGNPENKTKEKMLKNEAPVVGLSSIFSYIKNSFLGSEKQEPELSPKSEKEQAASKTNDEPVEEMKKEGEELTTNVIPIDEGEHDTLSHKLSTYTACVINKNLTIKVQENVEVLNETKSNNEKVVKELLEASSEFHLVETLDYTVSREDDDDESIISEKSFAQELKNLQVLIKSKKDDTDAAKESIDTILNDNNILQEQQDHNSPPAEVLSDDNSNAVNNINLIDWRESPFPVKNMPNLLENAEAKAQAKPELHDKETFTDPYDFNVVFIGADDFKVIEAHDRNINEGNVTIMNDVNSSGRKLMLHKGTMTAYGDFLCPSMADYTDYPLPESRVDELYKIFQDKPSILIFFIYEYMCARDFNWAKEYIRLLSPEVINEAMKMIDAGQQENALHILIDASFNLPKGNAANQAEPASKQHTSSSESSNSSPLRQPQKNQQKNIVTQELEREFREKFVLSEKSYSPHTLCVKRWKHGDLSPKKQPGQNLISFDDNQSKLDQIKRPERPTATIDSQTSTEEESSEEEGSAEEMMELKIGHEFIKTLEAQFGNSDFPSSDGLFPVIQIKKSMARELYALWIDSMQKQLWTMHTQLDNTIAKDAEYAKKIEDEEVKKAIAITEPEVPNLKEIMDMEMALAIYSKDSMKDYKGVSPKQIEAMLTRDTLVEMFPDCDRDMIFGIYDAHDRSFSETVKIIKQNCRTQCKLTMADILKKRNHLIDKLQKASNNQTSKYSKQKHKGSDKAWGNVGVSKEWMTYEDALEEAHKARAEARYQLALRNENYRKANEHCQKKNPQVAAYYSDVAKLHIRNMEAANLAAASAYLAAQVHMLDNENTLDLHFLHVAEAIEALHIFLDHKLCQIPPGGHKNIHIITGRGLRSIDGRSKIKPAICQELNSKNLRFVEVNPGMLKVTLRKK